MKAPRRAPPSAPPTPERPAAGAHPNARAVYEHVERYEIGACNEEGLENWRLAVARSLEIGQTLDVFIEEIAGMYLKEYGLPGQGRHAPSNVGRAEGHVRGA